MAWIRVESSVARNRKFMHAGPQASWLWLCGLAYCQEGLTDGFIPAEALLYLGVKGPRPLATRLEQAGLWEPVDGGWRVHDYLQHNRPATEVRRIQHERREGGKKGGRPPDEKPSSETLKGNLPDNPATASTATARTTTARTTHTDAPAAHTHGLAPLHATHRHHASCGRICVPAGLHAQFMRHRNHLNADQELRAWYLEVEREWAVGTHQHDSPGADAFAFWRARFDEQWPQTVKTRVSKPTAGPEKADDRGHVPPCASWAECRDRALADARAEAREGATR